MSMPSSSIDGIFSMIFSLFIFEGLGVVTGGLFSEPKVSWSMLGILFNILSLVIRSSSSLFFLCFATVVKFFEVARVEVKVVMPLFFCFSLVLE